MQILHLSKFFTNFARKFFFVMKKLCIVIVCMLLLVSCKTNQFIAGSDITRIEFGGGGGFAGTSRTYSILPNRNVLENGATVKTVSRKQLSKIMDLAGDLGSEIFHPGNVYYFIYIYRGDSKIQYVWSWGDELPDSVKDLYKELNSFVQ